MVVPTPQYADKWASRACQNRKEVEAVATKSRAKSGGKKAREHKVAGKLKQQSNAASTGGAGVIFENEVQASFVALMATGGYAPALPTWPIARVALQTKPDGYHTDD